MIYYVMLLCHSEFIGNYFITIGLSVCIVLCFSLTMIKKCLREKERKELLFLELLLGHVLYCSLYLLSLSFSSLVIVCILIIFCSYRFSFCSLKRDNYYSKTSVNNKANKEAWQSKGVANKKDFLKHQAATNNTIIYSTLETFLYSKTHIHTHTH